MKAEINANSQKYQIDFSQGKSLGIPIGVTSPLFFIQQPPTISKLSVDGFSGSVATGAGCNVEQVCFTPHCHGTHTEGSGHISQAAETVHSLIDQTPCPARLISLQPELAADCAENYACELPTDYPLITLDLLQAQLQDSQLTESGLIIRSLPNPVEKSSRNYNQQPYYPLLTTAAISWLASSGLRHLLLDMPSLDYANDAGILRNHHIWWGLEETVDTPDFASSRSLTEMIFADDTIADGYYWLELNLSSLESDASPSNPKIYPLQRVLAHE